MRQRCVPQVLVDDRCGGGGELVRPRWYESLCTGEGVKVDSAIISLCPSTEMVRTC